MKKPRNFSVVIATYTGIGTIEATFNSLLEQVKPGLDFEVVVVIDGPNIELRQIVDTAEQNFMKRKISFRIEQFKRNKGRFEARLAGAKQAKNGYILIVDDRVVLPSDFLKRMTLINEEAIMSDVQEKTANNFVSLTLNRLRRKFYGNRWDADFKSFYIDNGNFDSSPKGTTALWVNRRKFIDACEQVISQAAETKYLNDDTRILKHLVDNGTKIYKTSELKIFYEPRSKSWDELVHIYHRGPRFIDYYLRPGTRFFPALLIFYLSLIPLIVSIVIWPWLLLAILLLLIAAGIFISKRPREILITTAGVGAICLFFGAGLAFGLIKKVVTE